MTAQNATSEYIEFLCQRGSISHVVSSPPGASISTLALTQRCLASGIEFPVPLPDGTVGINIEGDVPAALAALDLVIEAVPGAGQVEPRDEVEAADGEASEISPEEGDFTEADVDAIPEEALLQGHSAVDEEDEVASAESETELASDDAISADSEVEPADGTQGSESDGVPMFMRSGSQASSMAASDGPGGGESLGECTAEESDAAGISPEIPAQEDPVEESVSAEADAVDEAFMVMPESEPDAEPEAGPPASDVADRLIALEAAVASLSEGQVQLSSRFDAFDASLEDMVSKPVPRPDAVEFNRGMARMTAAFAHLMRRVDILLDAMPEPGATGGENVAEPLATGLSAIAEAVRASASAQNPAASELTLIASMQETLSHQLAKLIEASQSRQPPEMEEFLLDLRHATAELLAEQSRLAQTG